MGINRLLEHVELHGNIVLDTNIIIYYLEHNRVYGNAVKEVFHFIEQGRARAHISVITTSEVYVKPIRDNNRHMLDMLPLFFRLFPNLSILDVTADIAYQAAIIRAKTGLKLPDALIAATAIINDSPILGNDSKWVAKKLPIPYYCLNDYI